MRSCRLGVELRQHSLLPSERAHGVRVALYICESYIVFVGNTKGKSTQLWRKQPLPRSPRSAASRHCCAAAPVLQIEGQVHHLKERGHAGARLGRELESLHLVAAHAQRLIHLGLTPSHAHCTIRIAAFNTACVIYLARGPEQQYQKSKNDSFRRTRWASLRRAARRTAFKPRVRVMESNLRLRCSAIFPADVAILYTQ